VAAAARFLPERGEGGEIFSVRNEFANNREEGRMGVAEQTKVSGACWSCRADAAGAHFCPSCGKIQPLPREADYFSFLGLPEKLALDPADLDERFLRLSWRLHPDNFVRASPYEQTLALERSSQLNDAYRTLADPVARVEYLLGRYGARKEGETRQQAPPELLEEVFELNESLEELRAACARRSAEHASGEAAGHRRAGAARTTRDGGELESLRARLAAAGKSFEEKLAEVDGELEAVMREWDCAGADPEGRSKLFARLNEILNRRSYVRNLVRSVRAELEEG
jgi:molecular chaperone HscB